MLHKSRNLEKKNVIIICNAFQGNEIKIVTPKQIL